jgi:hypothetical protein
MRSVRLAAVAATFTFACGSTLPDDVLPDSGSGKDGSVVTDSGKTDSSVDGGKKDGSSMDASMDSSMEDGAMDSSVVDSGIDTGVFDAQPLDGGIASISGLVLWLDAAKGITKNNQNQVSKWADQSSNANDAIQNTSAMQPVWSGSVFNGFPALHFDMSNTQVVDIADSSSLQWGTGDFLIEVVARFNNDYTNNEIGLFYGKIGQSSGIIFFATDAANADDGISAAIDGNNLIGYTANYRGSTPRLYGFQRSGSTLSLRTNGAQVASQAQTGNVDVSANGEVAQIGDFQTNAPLDGDIAEVVAVKGAISSQDLTSLETFLKAKYGL